MKVIKKLVKVIATITALFGMLGIFAMSDDFTTQIICTFGSFLTLFLSFAALKWADPEYFKED